MLPVIQYTNLICVPHWVCPIIKWQGGHTRNYPNPFYGATTISYLLLSASESAVFEVYQPSGKRIYQQSIGAVTAGSHTFDFNMVLPSGMYYYSISTPYEKLVNVLAIER